MVKVTIECDGKQISHEGDGTVGFVVKKEEGGFGLDCFILGNMDSDALPEIIAEAAVNQVEKAYESKEKLDQLNMLAMFANKVRGLVSERMVEGADEIAGLIKKILTGGM